MSLLKPPSICAPKRGHLKGGGKMGTVPIQLDIASNYKKRPNRAQRIWPKGSTTFHFQSLQEQCPTSWDTLEVTNWSHCIILSILVNKSSLLFDYSKSPRRSTKQNLGNARPTHVCRDYKCTQRDTFCIIHSMGCYEEVWQSSNNSKSHCGYAHPQWGQLAK